MTELKQSTAGQEVTIGPFLDDTDGKTPEILLTIANTDIQIMKAGATAFINKNSGGAIVKGSNGYYQITLDETDSSVAGTMVIEVTMAGALPVKEVVNILISNMYDSKYSTDYLQVDIVEAGGSSITGVDDFKADVSNLDDSISSRSSHNASDVWSSVSRTLTAGTKDTEVDAIKTKTDSLTFTTSNKVDSRIDAVGSNAVTTPNDFKLTVAEIKTGITDGSLDMEEMLRLMLSLLVAKSSGGGTNSYVFRDISDTKNRISMTVDDDGNRLTVTVDGA